MNILKFVLTVFSLFFVSLGIESKEDRGNLIGSTSSNKRCWTLIAPPGYITMKFYGGQGIIWTFKNNNTLGFLGNITYYRVGEFTSSVTLAPMCWCDTEYYYSHFGYVPLSWHFDFESVSTAAHVAAYVEDAPPGYHPPY